MEGFTLEATFSNLTADYACPALHIKEQPRVARYHKARLVEDEYTPFTSQNEGSDVESLSTKSHQSVPFRLSDGVITPTPGG